MKLEIVSEKPNPLLARKEFVLSATGAGASPARAMVIESAVSKLKCSADCLVVNRIMPSYGSNSFSVEADVYDSAEALAKYAHPKLAMRGKPKEAKAEAAKPAEKK